MSVSIEGDISQQIKPVLVQELTNRYNIPDEAEDVAEYLLVLIAGNKTPPEILTEIKELVDAPIDENFINSLFEEIKKLIDQRNQQQQQQQQQQPQQQQPPQNAPEAQMAPAQMAPVPQGPAAQAPAPAATVDDDDAMSDDHVDFRSLPNRPSGARQGRGGKFGGVGKSGRGGKKSFGVSNPNNFEKMLNMNPEHTKFVPHKPKGRCRDFPGCKNRDCKFAHPTKECNAYPACPNPPGTCNFLHPGEDQELMAKLEVSKKEYLERRQQNRPRHSKPEPMATGISICKYGALCSRELCPFGHPTPANIEAKVMDIVWCEGGKGCQDNSCRKAHPSPGYLAPPPEARPPPKFQNSAPGGGPGNKILEQCKFGMGCTNFNCPRRHATSPVACREGANCQRITCTFAHPIDEDCRFGLSCTNKTCMYRHPEGRSQAGNTWVKGQDEGVDERSYAVPEDQVMERAEQPSLV